MKVVLTYYIHNSINIGLCVVILQENDTADVCQCRL